MPPSPTQLERKFDTNLVAGHPLAVVGALWVGDLVQAGLQRLEVAHWQGGREAHGCNQSWMVVIRAASAKLLSYPQSYNKSKGTQSTQSKQHKYYVFCQI